MKFHEEVIENGGGVSSDIAQTYEATVLLTLTKVDIGSWTFTGRASISGSFTSNYESHTTSALGPCNVHYTDDASGSGTVNIVDGGLEARDGLYQFFVNVPGIDSGVSNSVRDDSGCFGGNSSETNPWSIAPTSASGSGDYTNQTHLSGSSSEPRSNGANTITWDFTIEP